MSTIRCLLTVVLSLALCFTSYAKTYILCLGIEDYPGTKNDLRVSADDAETMAKVFRTSGAAVSKLLNEEVTKQTVLSKVKTFLGQAQAADVVILYFSGHGYPGGLACHDGKLPYSSIFEAMKPLTAHNKVIIADACFSGKMRKNTKQVPKYDKYDVMLFLSSRSSEMSLESPHANSMFTIYLERGLRGGADYDRNRIITAQEIFKFVHKGVAEATKEKQHPVMWGNFDDDMPLIQWNNKK